MEKDNKKIKFSIIIPVFNEEDNVAVLHQEIIEVMKDFSDSFEIIFVNDGSEDETLNNLRALSPVKIINFRKRFGQTQALDAGIKNASGEYLITMDGDLQNDPQEIPNLYNKLVESNLDVVSGWRKNRKDKFFKKISSRAMCRLRRFMINDKVHDSGCTLKIYKKECFKNINLYGEMHRFIPALLKIKGFKIGEIEVNHRYRTSGKTKYNWRRGVKGLLDLFSVWFWYKYSNRPLHFFGGFGLLLIFFSFISASIAFYQKIFQGQSLSDTVITELSMFSFFVGSLFFVFGLISDILIKIYFSSTKDNSYNIKEFIENEEQKNEDINA
jgi:glycosyltransferase involved in cell wall biosynthesis